MGNVALLLDNYKKARSIRSDNALSVELDVSRQVVSQWRAGDSYPSPERIAQIAEAASLDAGAWVLAVQNERAGGAERRALRSVLKRLGVAAMPIMSSVRAWMRRVATPLARLLPATRRSPVPLSIPLGA